MLQLWNIVLKIIEIIEARLHFQLIWVPGNEYFVKFSEFGALRQSNRKDGSILPLERDFTSQIIRWPSYSATISISPRRCLKFLSECYTQDSPNISQPNSLRQSPNLSGRHLSPAKCFSVNWGWTILYQKFLVTFRRIAFVL